MRVEGEGGDAPDITLSEKKTTDDTEPVERVSGDMCVLQAACSGGRTGVRSEIDIDLKFLHWSGW